MADSRSTAPTVRRGLPHKNGIAGPRSLRLPSGRTFAATGPRGWSRPLSAGRGPAFFTTWRGAWPVGIRRALFGRSSGALLSGRLASRSPVPLRICLSWAISLSVNERIVPSGSFPSENGPNAILRILRTGCKRMSKILLISFFFLPLVERDFDPRGGLLFSHDHEVHNLRRSPSPRSIPLSMWLKVWSLGTPKP